MSGHRITSPIPSLINGISQQAPAFRLPSQAELQVNALSSVLDGLSKRPPVEHRAKLSAQQFGNAFIHTIDRDDAENYTVVVTNGNLRVFDMLNNGKESTVTFPNGKAYLQNAKPEFRFGMTTVADYTFVVNKDVTVQMNAAEAKEIEKNQAIVFIKKGVIDTTYRVMVNGFWASYTTPSPSSTVTTTTSGEEEGATVNPSAWNWTQCYNWLRDNNQTIPRDWDPYQWSDKELGYFYYRRDGVEITHGGAQTYIIDDCLDRPDDFLQYYSDHGDAVAKARASDSLIIKQNMRNYVVTTMNQMHAAGMTTSVSSTINEGSQPSTDKVAENLAALLRANLPGFTIDVIGSSMRIYRADNQDFSFAVTDSWGNEASLGIKREVQKFQDLPARAWDGFRVRVVGENPTRDDDYYLEYSSDSFYKNGVWRESRGWNQLNQFNAATMPHILVRNADGTFTFKQAAWKERKCGDDHSVPLPAFIGGKIADVAFYRNRLVFLVDENVVASGAGEYFQFWPDTATSVLATDAIDQAIAHSSNEVALLQHATVFGENLLLAASNVQFQFGCGAATYLAPDTATATISTRYPCSAICKPVQSGQCLYFVADNGDYSIIREYPVSQDTVSDDAPDVTSHIPKLIPKNVTKMASLANDGTLFALSSVTPDCVYVYRYFWVGEEKLQSSWSVWKLASNAKILSIACLRSVLYLIVQYPDGTYLESINMTSRGEEDTLGFKVHLDRKTRVKGIYNASTDRTSWTLPYAVNSSNFTMVLDSGFKSVPPCSTIPALTVSGVSVSAAGRFDESTVIAGFQYEKRYRFSELFVREGKDNGSPTVKSGRLQIIDFSVSYQNSGYFRLEVTPDARKARAVEHKQTLGALNTILGKPLIESGTIRTPILSRSNRVTIDIVNPSHYPSCFQDAEWTGTFVSDARRL